MTNYSLKSYLQILFFFFLIKKTYKLAGKCLLKQIILFKTIDWDLFLIKKGEDRSIILGQPYKKIDHPVGKRLAWWNVKKSLLSFDRRHYLPPVSFIDTCSEMYVGASLSMALKVNNKILKTMRYATGNQCRALGNHKICFLRIQGMQQSSGLSAVSESDTQVSHITDYCNSQCC